MEGVWSWVDHIHAIHSRIPILQSTRPLRQLKFFFFRQMKFRRMKNQCLRDEGVDSSSHCMRAFVWDLKVPIKFPKFLLEFPDVPNGVPNGSTFQKEEVRVL